MANVRNFHEKLEQDIARLTAEVGKRKESPDRASSHEVVKESLKAMAPVSVPPAIPPEENVAPTPQKADDSHLPSYLSRESPEVREEVERLVTLALEEGIDPAVREAAKKSPFLLDALHDALAEKLLPELERRGVL